MSSENRYTTFPLLLIIHHLASYDKNYISLCGIIIAGIKFPSRN